MTFDFIEQFTQPTNSRYLFGATEEASKLIDIFSELGLEVKSVIDSFYPDEHFNSVPCIRLEDVPKDALVLSCVTNSRPVDVAKLLDSHQLTHCDNFTFKRSSNIECPDIAFWDGAKSHYDNNTQLYEQVKAMLSDERSKDVFDAVVQFRVQCNLKYMEGFDFDISNMYFEPFVFPFSDRPVFFDLGAFDGYDSKRFLSYEKEGSCYMFEPIPDQLNHIQGRFENEPRAHLLPFAVGDSQKQVSFSLSGTSSKVVSDAQNDANSVTVEQITLDGFITDKAIMPSFIKMDVEGAEMGVLEGFKETIKTHKPKLAVSVYHNVTHIIDVPLLLKSLNPDYTFYLRHYTQGYSETVLFAV